MHPQVRFASFFGLTAVVAYLVAGCTTGQGDVYAKSEAEELNRIHLAAEGQFNCVQEALARTPTPKCAYESTKKPYPAEGILVLDDFYIQPGGPASPKTILDDPATAVLDGSSCWQASPTSCSGPLATLLTGMNTARASRGELPDIILPGAGQFQAAYGWFDNVNGDDSVRLDNTGRTAQGAVTTGPENEFVRKPQGVLVSFIDPGAHPGVDSMTRPGDIEPDIWYQEEALATSTTDYFYIQRTNTLGGAPVTLWVDGSVLRTVKVTTVTDPIFAPQPDGRPYTPSSTSLVDIDVYAALAPGPIQEIYAANAGPTMDSWASPSWGNCPNACVPGPIGLGGTPLVGPGGFAQGLVYAKYLPETRAGSGNSAEGRLADFQTEYRGWIDILPAWRANAGVWFIPILWTPSMPLVASRDPSGAEEPTIPPGTLFAPEGWTGVWHDLSQDGRIGLLLDRDDPYQGGSRPNPDEYYDSRGEFLGVPPLAVEWINLTLYPDTDWGPGGIYRMVSTFPQDPTGECSYVNQGDLFCAGVNAYSTKPVRITLSAITAAGGGGWFVSSMPNPKGHWSSILGYLFPAGSPGFTMCTDPLTIEWTEGGKLVRDVVHDCDHIGRWLPAT